MKDLKKVENFINFQQVCKIGNNIAVVTTNF